LFVIRRLTTVFEEKGVWEIDEAIPIFREEHEKLH
jgi:hypothetical protein